MTVNFNQNNQPSPERIYTSKSVEEIFWIIGDAEFLRLLLKDEIEQQILYKRWKENKTLKTIAAETGLTLFNVEHRYAQITRKVKGQVKRFVNFYKLNNKQDLIKTSEKEKKTTTRLTAVVNLNPKVDADKPLKVLLTNNPKWIAAVEAKGIYTLGQIQNYTRREISLIPFIGPLAMKEIDFVMNYYNLSYKKDLLKKVSF